MTEMDREGARRAPAEAIPLLLHDAREEVLLGLLENPALNEGHVLLLLGRMELTTACLEQIAHGEAWMRSYRVRRALSFHPHVPQLLGLRLVRELYSVDLVRLALSPSGAPALRYLAEEMALTRLAQLPLGQKMMLARQGSARIGGALLLEGNAEVVPAVLESPFLTEGQVLRVLARASLPSRVPAAIAEHGRWSNIYAVRLALLRNGQAPLARLLAFLPALATPDLRTLATSAALGASLRQHVRHELAERMRRGTIPLKRSQH